MHGPPVGSKPQELCPIFRVAQERQRASAVKTMATTAMYALDAGKAIAANKCAEIFQNFSYMPVVARET